MAEEGAGVVQESRGLGDVEVGEDLAGRIEQVDGLGREAFGFGGA